MSKEYATLSALIVRNQCVWPSLFTNSISNLHFQETAQVVELVVVEESLFVDYRRVLVLEFLLHEVGSLERGPRVQVTKVLLEGLCSLVHQLLVAILIRTVALGLLCKKVLH